jgi:hypothetical protein
MARNLRTVAQHASSGPFTEAQIRWWLFNANSNGMKEAGAVIRIGRRIYIDEDGFERWLSAQNAARAA